MATVSSRRTPSGTSSDSVFVIQQGDAAPVALHIPPGARTHPGFRAWASSDAFPKCGQVSFLGGEIWIDMSPEIIETHTLIKLEVGYQLVGINRKEKRGLLLGDRVLLTNETAGLSTEADAAFAFWETLAAGGLVLVQRKGRRGQSKEIQGTPDWVLEILSDSSVVKDTQRLRDLYFRAGVPEYWIIDPRGDEMRFHILTRSPDGYVDAERRGKWQISPVFQRRFRLDRQRGPLGIWQYTLHHCRA